MRKGDRVALYLALLVLTGLLLGVTFLIFSTSTAANRGTENYWPLLVVEIFIGIVLVRRIITLLILDALVLERLYIETLLIAGSAVSLIEAGFMTYLILELLGQPFRRLLLRLWRRVGRYRDE